MLLKQYVHMSTILQAVDDSAIEPAMKHTLRTIQMVIPNFKGAELLIDFNVNESLVEQMAQCYV